MFSVEIIEKKQSKKLYQWDLDRQIKITVPEGIEVDEVHFAHEHDAVALVVSVKNEDGVLVADIPNIHLQSCKPIRVWLVSEDQTVYSHSLIVIPRAKPADYVYTETEVLRYESLEARIKALEENGGGGSTGETWTTLYDITLEEDVNTIEVTTDMDGNAFKARKIRAFFDGTVNQARLHVISNSGNAVADRNMQNTYFYTMFTTNKSNRAILEIGEQLPSGHCKLKALKNAEPNEQSYTLGAVILEALASREKEFLDKLKLQLYDSGLFESGMRIIIEGVLE